MLQFLPLAILGLGGGTWYAVSKRKAKAAGMTAERKLIFDQLVNSTQEPKVLREMAEVYERNGLKPAAELLRKRAALRELPADKKAQYKQIFRDAMSDKDPKAVDAVAAAFEKQGATGNAAALRAYAQSLRTARTAAPDAPGPPANTSAPAPVSTPAAPPAAPPAAAPQGSA